MGFRASEHVPSSREWLGMLAASSSRRTSPPNAVRARRKAGGGVSELPTFITAFPCASGEKSRAGFFSGHCQQKTRLHAATMSQDGSTDSPSLARHSPSRFRSSVGVEPRISAMDSIRETLEKAGGVPESARVAIDGGVDAVVHTLSKQVAVAVEHVSGYADVASAHADAASHRLKEYEDRFFRVPTLTVTNAVTSYPYQTAAGALGASLLIVPATRRLFVKALLGARSSEEAIFNRASRGAASVKDSVVAAEKELKALRDAAVAAEVERRRDADASSSRQRTESEPLSSGHRPSSSDGSESRRRVRTPSVTTSMRVCRPTLLAPRTR